MDTTKVEAAEIIIRKDCEKSDLVIRCYNLQSSIQVYKPLKTVYTPESLSLMDVQDLKILRHHHFQELMRLKTTCSELPVLRDTFPVDQTISTTLIGDSELSVGQRYTRFQGRELVKNGFYSENKT